jgi:hypothetical protein
MEKVTGDVFDLVLIEDLPGYKQFKKNTDDPRVPDDVLVPVTAPSGESVLVSLSPGSCVIVAESGDMVAVSGSHIDQYEWLED